MKWEIEGVVEKVEVNGQVKQYKTKLNIAPGTRIFTVQDAGKEFSVAGKVGGRYYTEIFAYNL